MLYLYEKKIIYLIKELGLIFMMTKIFLDVLENTVAVDQNQQKKKLQCIYLVFFSGDRVDDIVLEFMKIV